jgi:hypothetical protein
MAGNKEPEECKACIYKRLAEQYMKEKESGKGQVMTTNIGSTGPSVTNPGYAVTPVSQIVAAQQQPIQENTGKKGLFQRFCDYRSRNLKAMKAAGETSLMDDLQGTGGSWMKGIANGAGSLGEEEIANISARKRAKHDPSADDELTDFLMGKKRKQS